MNMDKNYLNQALYPPIEDLALIETHIRLVSSIREWSDVAILVDEGIKAILILMLDNNQIVSMLRFCFSVDESVSAIELLRGENGKILFGSYQGKVLDEAEIRCLSRINTIWVSIPDQIVEFSIDEVRVFFQRIEDDSRKTGRGDSFSVATKRKVLLDSHGRCMFEGCGQDLGIDDLTGTKGNFSYLAHNIASSEQGARGVVELSDKLSDEPNNILLLCDKHHRLIDKVAAADYPAHRLSEMRRNFSTVVNKLLEGLGYQPVPVYVVLWPVHRQVISAPTDVQIAQSLATIRCRMHSQLSDMSDNEAILRETDPGLANKILTHSITLTAERILSQGHISRYRAGLFAFGLMPSLIALGALLGNKNNITPMLRYRETGQWAWPLDEPMGKFYNVFGLENLSNAENEVVLTVALTAEPDNLKNARQKVSEATGAKLISVVSLPECTGNGALGHPEDGYSFTNSMQKLMHSLRDKHGVKRIHLFPCASNAACVFFGQAFDSHHPEIIVYDFIADTMEQRLLIKNDENRCEVRSI